MVVLLYLQEWERSIQKWKHQSAHNIFPIIRLWRFFRRSRAAYSVDPGPILPNCKSIQALIAVLVTSKNKEDPLKNEGARVLTTLYIHFQTLKVSLLSSWWWDLAEIQTHSSFYTCTCYLQWDEDQFKNESTSVLTTILPLYVYEDMFRRLRALNQVDPGPILPNFKPIQAFIAVLVTCKKEDPMENGRARVLTRFVSCLKVWTDPWTHGRRLESHPISSPRALGSEEPKIEVRQFLDGKHNDSKLSDTVIRGLRLSFYGFHN